MSGRALHEQKSYNQTMIIKKINNLISFKCIYEIKDYNEIQIINYRGKKEINEEPKSKIKIKNGDKIEDLVFRKKFDKIGLNTIEFLVDGNLTNMGFLFNGCSSLKQIEFISFDTSQVKNMNSMFQECNELEYMNLSNFNTSNVTDMGHMFAICQKLKKIQGISKFNTSKVINMKIMFCGCEVIEFLDLSNFDTSNVKNMDNMFSYCYKLKEIKGIENFNLLNLTNADEIFEECNDLRNYEELVFLFGENNNPNIQSMDELNVERKDLTINFTSIDQRIKYSMNCCNLDVFSSIKEKLCLKFAELKNKKIFFLSNGNILKKNLTLEQNKIKDGEQILICINE